MPVLGPLDELKLLTLRNTVYSRWLGTGKQGDFTRFNEARGAARQAVRKAKNRWFQESGRTHIEVDKRIAYALKAFGALRRAVFKDTHLSVTTKRSVYRACVLSVLLYGGECWIPLRKDLKKLNIFHHRCVRIVLGITNQRQWEESISSTMVREQWGDVETIEIKLVKRCLEWLGHLTRMQDHRLPKICLFGYLRHDHAEVQEGGGETW